MEGWAGGTGGRIRNMEELIAIWVSNTPLTAWLFPQVMTSLDYWSFV